MSLPLPKFCGTQYRRSRGDGGGACDGNCDRARHLAGHGAAPGELDSIHVGEVMTRDLITAKPEDQLLQMMDVMAENKIRHLPILEGDRLAGIISIGDLVNACRVVAEEENSQLRQYIAGAG